MAQQSQLIERQSKWISRFVAAQNSCGRVPSNCVSNNLSVPMNKGHMQPCERLEREARGTSLSNVGVYLLREAARNPNSCGTVPVNPGELVIAANVSFERFPSVLGN